VSVDTYLKGKDTSSYRRIHHDDIVILVAKRLTQHASRIELVTRKKLLGSAKLVAIAHHQHTAACRH
jgi:hypothetical protein